jgi:hypothetical protein
MEGGADGWEAIAITRLDRPFQVDAWVQLPSSHYSADLFLTIPLLHIFATGLRERDQVS